MHQVVQGVCTDVFEKLVQSSIKQVGVKTMCVKELRTSNKMSGELCSLLICVVRASGVKRLNSTMLALLK